MIEFGLAFGLAGFGMPKKGGEVLLICFEIKSLIFIIFNIYVSLAMYTEYVFSTAFFVSDYPDLLAPLLFIHALGSNKAPPGWEL